jgi:hydroxylamine dehydrogenase
MMATCRKMEEKMRRLLSGMLFVSLVCMLWWAGISAQEPKDSAQPEGQKQTEEQTTVETPDAPQTPENQCVACHREVTPRIVSDWELSKHFQNDVTCDNCHGNLHTSRDDSAQAQPALPEKCGECHLDRVEQFNKGKHSLAWMSMNAMPTLHWQPMAQIEGLKGCGGCHRIGMKSEGVVKDLISKKSGGGVSSCDTCHTRHIFSLDEARSPQACQTCHMGMDHPQWEMYSSSKHGVRYLLKQSKVLPEDAAAPTCQMCHMPEGNHGVRTAWGYLGVRLPMPEDLKWAADRTTILQGLGVLDPSGAPTARMEVLKAADVWRSTREEWESRREAMLRVCTQCHAANFAKAELENGDRMIQEGDRLMAEAIRTIGDLYREGVLKKPESYLYPFPDILTFHDAPTVIEQKLFLMFLEYRMRTFKGAFHANPDYSFWYGWSAMQRSLTEIREKATEMKEAALRAQKEASAAAGKPTSPPAWSPKKKK